MKLCLTSLIFSLSFATANSMPLKMNNKNQVSVPVEVTYYRGNYFDIAYPRGFSAKPLTPVSTNDGFAVATDEAYFASQDGTVEFFVYSPLWGGRPKNYLKVAPTEELVSQKSKEQIKSDKYRDKVITTRTTVKAKDGSYTRSFVHIKTQKSDASGGNLSRVFGIKYKNQNVYDKYLAAYNAFKKSLEQHSD